MKKKSSRRKYGEADAVERGKGGRGGSVTSRKPTIAIGLSEAPKKESTLHR